MAAVAVSVVEDLDYGEANARSVVRRGAYQGPQVKPVLDDVRHERHRQDRKWGPQHHDPQGWMLILMEEVGEAAVETEPWKYPTSRDTLFRQKLLKDIAILGKSVQRYLDENEGKP